MIRRRPPRNSSRRAGLALRRPAGSTPATGSGSTGSGVRALGCLGQAVCRPVCRPVRVCRRIARLGQAVQGPQPTRLAAGSAVQSESVAGRRPRAAVPDRIRRDAGTAVTSLSRPDPGPSTARRDLRSEKRDNREAAAAYRFGAATVAASTASAPLPWPDRPLRRRYRAATASTARSSARSDGSDGAGGRVPGSTAPVRLRVAGSIRVIAPAASEPSPSQGPSESSLSQAAAAAAAEAVGPVEQLPAALPGQGRVDVGDGELLAWGRARV